MIVCMIAIAWMRVCYFVFHPLPQQHPHDTQRTQHIEETLYHNQLVPSADSVRERAVQDPQLPRRVPLGAQSLLRSFIGSESIKCVCVCV